MTARLPDGHLTLLFTDIEGSTRLLHARDDFAQMLAEHHAILRAAIAATGGYEVGTNGDSFFVVWTDPMAAAAAVGQVQRALAAHAWPQHARVRVRMGLHTGVPQVAVDNYVGVDVGRQSSQTASAGASRRAVSVADGRLASEA